MANFIGRQIKTHEELVGWVEEMVRREQRRNRSVWVDWLNNIAAYHGRLDLRMGQDLRIARRLTASQRAELEEIAVNWVQPHVRTLTAHIQKGRPILECLPSTSDEADIQAAKVGDRLEASEWQQQDMDRNRLASTTWMGTTGNGFWHVYFDRNQGPRLGQEEEGPNVGELRCDSLNPFKIVFEPHRTDIERCRWCIITERFPRDEVEDKYSESYFNLSKGGTLNLGGPEKASQKGDDVANAYMAIVGLEPNASEDDNDYVDVNTLYHLPTAQYPQGLYAIISGRELLHVGPYPYPFLGQLPVCHFREILSPWRLYGDTGTSSVLRAQEYFVMLRKLERVYLRKHSRGKWLIPQGLRIRRNQLTSLNPDDDFVAYSGKTGLKPEWIPGQNPPDLIFRAMEAARDDGNRASGVGEASQGIRPDGVNSGRALLALQEMDATRLGITVQLAEIEYARWGRMTLQMAKNFYTEKRKYSVAGDSRSAGVWFFDRSDLGSTADVRCVPGSAMPQNKIAKQETVMQMFQAGLLGNPQDPETIGKTNRLLEFGQHEAVQDETANDEAVAEKENVSMVNVGTNILSAGFQDPQQLMQAVMPIGDFDDDRIHLQVHRRRWTAPGVRDNPALAGIIGAHMQQHIMRLNPPPMPIQPPAGGPPQEGQPQVATGLPQGDGPAISDQGITQEDVKDLSRGGQ